MSDEKLNWLASLVSRVTSIRSGILLVTSGIGLNRLWVYLKCRERARVHMDSNTLNREHALWREIGELKAQVHALEVKLATDAKVRDWLVQELSSCRLILLLTMGEVNAECMNQSRPPRYDLRQEADLLRQRVPPTIV